MNTPYITEITAAQLAAKIALEGLDEGRLYNITDSGKWIMATSTTEYINLIDGLKWKSWKALISQAESDPAVVRVLNASDPDYLGDVEWALTLGGGIETVTTFDPSRTIILTAQSDTVGSAIVTSKTDASTGVISLTNGDNDFVGQYVEIRERQRGVAPQVLRIDTNEAGDELTITCDRPMNPYIFTDALDGFTLAGDSGAAVTALEADGSALILTLDTAIEVTDVDTLSFDALIAVESLDLGLLAAFDDLPIINNVVEPS